MTWPAILWSCRIQGLRRVTVTVPCCDSYVIIVTLPINRTNKDCDDTKIVRLWWLDGRVWWHKYCNNIENDDIDIVVEVYVKKVIKVLPTVLVTNIYFIHTEILVLKYWSLMLVHVGKQKIAHTNQNQILPIMVHYMTVSWSMSVEICK